MARPARVLIDLEAIRHNYRHAQSLSPSSQTLAVVKANAYGHGAIAVAKALEAQVPAFGVACIEEALELREAGITKPILLLEGAFEADEVEIAAQQNFWLMLENQYQVDALVNAKLASPVHAWLKVDSGMHRLGIKPEQTKDVYERLKSSDNVSDIVLATHLACGDDLGGSFTETQLAVFKEATAGIDAPVSLANSPGLLGWEGARGDWNRPGFMLYGNSPYTVEHENAKNLRPAMTLETGVIGVREVEAGDSVGYAATWVAQRPSIIATIAMGYGDGYPRHAPSGTPVIVNGQRAPLVGRVSMDMITVDVTDLPPVKAGDKVVCWGPDLLANEIAQHAGTIGYEVLTRMTNRVPKVYIG